MVTKNEALPKILFMLKVMRLRGCLKKYPEAKLYLYFYRKQLVKAGAAEAMGERSLISRLGGQDCPPYIGPASGLSL